MSWLTGLFGAILPPKDKTQTQKNLRIEKLSESGIGRCTKFGRAHSNDVQKITLSWILHFILLLYWISGFSMGDVIS